MKFICSFLIAISACIFIIACQPKDELDKLGEIISLKIGESIDIQENLAITLDGIPEDSRCPTGVNCFWEGQVRVNMSINETESIELILRAGKESLAKDTLNNLVYTLLEVSPYPDINGPVPIPSEQYTIDFRVDLL